MRVRVRARLSVCMCLRVSVCMNVRVWESVCVCVCVCVCGKVFDNNVVPSKSLFRSPKRELIVTRCNKVSDFQYELQEYKDSHQLCGARRCPSKVHFIECIL